MTITLDMVGIITTHLIFSILAFSLLTSLMCEMGSVKLNYWMGLTCLFGILSFLAVLIVCFIDPSLLKKLWRDRMKLSQEKDYWDNVIYNVGGFRVTKAQFREIRLLEATNPMKYRRVKLISIFFPFYLLRIINKA